MLVAVIIIFIVSSYVLFLLLFLPPNCDKVIYVAASPHPSPLRNSGGGHLSPSAFARTRLVQSPPPKKRFRASSVGFNVYATVVVAYLVFCVSIPLMRELYYHPRKMGGRRENKKKTFLCSVHDAANGFN